MKTITDNRLSAVWECIREKPNNLMMSLWVKRMMCIATMWAMFYSYQCKSYRSIGLLLIALVVWFFDALVTNSGVFLYFDVICVTIVSGVVCSVFMSGELGFASCFICVTVAVIALFILGMYWGNFISLLIFAFMTILFNIQSLDWIHRAYTDKFCERFPYMMICFLAIANFMVYSMNRYVVSKRDYQGKLNEMIISEKQNRREISLKILITMHRAMAAKSPSIAKHSEITAEWTNKIAIEMGLHNGGRHRYYYAGLLHDIGKIGLPDEFWDKDEISDEEYEIYKQHVDMGYKVLKKLRLEEISDAALYHHEKWKGNGYKGLRANEIPEIARIVGVANYIARLMQRGLKFEDIKRELIAEGGKAYDIRIVEVACRLIDECIKEEEEKKIFGY